MTGDDVIALLAERLGTSRRVALADYLIAVDVFAAALRLEGVVVVEGLGRDGADRALPRRGVP